MSKRIVKLSATDVLRLSAVEITPGGNVITLGGKNGAGKTSVLTAIQMALGGKRAMPKRPIRDGAEKAQVVLDLGDLVVERVVTKKTDRLAVKTRDGAVYQKPQQLLDKLFTSISFDPLAFTLKKPADQAEELRRLLGVDLSDLDAQHERVYEKRADVNRNGRDLKGQIAKMPKHDDAPEAEVSVKDLVAELEQREAVAKQHNDEREELENARGQLQADQELAQKTRDKVAELESLLRHTKEALQEYETRVERRQGDCDALHDKIAEQVWPDLDEIKTQISESEATNRKVRANQRRAEQEHRLDWFRKQSEEMTAKLDAIKADREKRIAEAEFPVNGLGFGEDGITMHGRPFDQASRAEQIRVSVAVGIAANPELRVFLVRDGSVLDEDSLALLTELAEQHDCQIWLEDARTRDETAVIIEDGRVAGVEPEKAEGEAA